MASPKYNILLSALLLSFWLLALAMLIGISFSLFLCVCGSGGIARAEDAVCYAASGNFHGLCFSSSNCANVCQGEGFPGGDCHLLACRCSRPCATKN
ncbi:hypothetical protein EJ110_NYTH07666 [Nymphaea thermarum]|nr:hypothetical protein EJ110_NYTH07666 [Nymphaea thermarum]